ncbi:DinB family protein [Gracilibacillus phocaeensis]|uniref:DinB family protein n=1 Tax=Gracilibacillus phocaeensis TaxID=2042304 RepID=UPI00103122BC|nr:DinB family protein [Gracilibacillus phocaeensis]
MHTKEVILAQLAAVHDQNGWFVSMTSALQGVSEAEATWRNHPDANTIWGIVHHLLYYNQGYLNRFKGTGGTRFTIATNDQTFDNLEGYTWEEALRSIDQVMQEWRQVIKEASYEHFNEKVEDLTHLMIHNAYHIGQIVDIRKQQGTWNAEFGVD